MQNGTIIVPAVEEITSKNSQALSNFYAEIDKIYDKDNFLSEIKGIYVEYINQGPNLKRFLDAGADNVLSEIDKIGKYRRALEVTKHKIDILTQADMKLGLGSWRFPEKDKEFGGKKMYGFHVIVQASDSVLDRIEFVTYRLSPVWPNPVRKVVDQKSHFGLKELAWGESKIYADVKIKDQNETITLYQPIILMEESEPLLPRETGEVTDLQVSATAIPGELKLNWKENNQTDLLRYDIYRSDSANFNVDINNPTSMATTNSYSDTGLTSGQPYYYRVAAVSTGNSRGQLSTEKSGTPV